MADSGEFYYVKDAGGGGDCFFFSIYEALKERDLMRKIKISAGSKEDFNILMRSLVVNSLDKGTCDTLFFNMQDFSAGNPDLHDVFGDTYQAWELKVFEKYRDERTSDNFCAEWLSEIRKPKIWVSNQVVNHVQEILKELGVNLVIITDRDPALADAEKDNKGHISIAYLTPKYDPKHPTIYLLNETYVDGHFKYFSKDSSSQQQWSQSPRRGGKKKRTHRAKKQRSKINRSKINRTKINRSKINRTKINRTTRKK